MMEAQQRNAVVGVKRVEVAPSVVRRQREIPPNEYLKILLVGKPKSAGKTTFALSMPGKKLILSYDLGLVPRVPGVDVDDIWVVEYPVADMVIQEQTDGWKRPVNVGSRIIKDAEAIRNAFVMQEPIKIGGVEVPLPDTLILDGLTELQAVALDWVLGVNRVANPEDFENRFTAWGKRLHYMRTLMNMLIPLPCNVVMTTWEQAEEVSSIEGGKQVSKATGRYIPDIGGKLDNVLPGKVDVVLRCFAKYVQGQVQHWVQCQPDGPREYVGVRGVYGLPKEVEVTLRGKTGELLPFERVFGKQAPAEKIYAPSSGMRVVEVNR